MRGELIFSTATLLGFFLTLVRVTGVFVFVPLPGVTSMIHPARLMLALGITIALFGQWPQVAATPEAGRFVLWIVSEAALGVAIGLCVAFVTESLAVGAQLLGLQAGYSFASTIDPMTQNDSTVLLVLAQTLGGLLFFVTGLDREILRVFARSLAAFPPGTFALGRQPVDHIVALGSSMLATGFRMALPVMAVLIMVDIALALLGRINAQLQLLTLAFPIKMMLGLALLGWVAMLIPMLFRAQSHMALEAAGGIVHR
jgi:flagellar biosynthetic protein FliR